MLKVAEVLHGIERLRNSCGYRQWQLYLQRDVRALATLPDRHRRLMTMLAVQPTADYRQISALLAIPRGSIGPIRARSFARLQRHPELRRLRSA